MESASGAGRELVRVNPARHDEVVGTLVTTEVPVVGAVVDAADVAQHHWAAMPLDERVAHLRAAARAVAARAEELAPLLARESGKPIVDSAGELGFAAAFLDWVCDRVGEVAADREVDDVAGRVLLTREPFGVVAAIVPWNAPLILSSLKVAPALATGNAIVVKPSPVAPFAVTEALATIAAHLPPGVLSVVHGDGDVGAALIGHRAVRKVAFTGGETVGRTVLHGCADSLTPAVLELGGNDAAVVLDDLTFSDEVMERLVFGAFLTAGQVCMAAKRLLVPEHRLDELTDAFVAAAERVLVCGDPLDPDVTIGPVATPAQVERVERLVDDARAQGATVIELGTTTAAFDPTRGWFVRPTLVRDVATSAALVEEEQFGPTLPVLAYRDLDEAIRMANGTELGLASSVWSDDEDRAFRVGRRLDAGMTFVNCHNRAGMSFRVPFGGVKRSGFGREFGDEGIAEYLQTHALHRPAAARLGARPSTGRNARPGTAYPTG
ncbi:MAG TPA: aldehyde dehydrogenase family protein [Microthrixaceae bacterium]|nr:aldehyde dehydrogenase family protein [Microthrixaceae bacterium]